MDMARAAHNRRLIVAWAIVCSIFVLASYSLPPRPWLAEQPSNPYGYLSQLPILPAKPFAAFDPNPYPTKPRITFSPDGTLKLTVFSDLHFGENPWDDWGPEQDRKSLLLIRGVLQDEQPDYVILNGDQITGENTFKENATALVDKLVAPLVDFGIPFSSSHGNHDNQVNITHKEEIEREQKVTALSYTRTTAGVGGVHGQGNYWVPIFRSNTDATPSLILWFFDSRGGVSPNSTNPDHSVAAPNPVPDWVDASVATWLELELAAMEESWGPAERRGALAFVHIPPYAIKDLPAPLYTGLNLRERLGKGSVQASEEESAKGNDAPFYDALSKIKNLHALVSGHDHGNEWCGREPKKDVVFCFDKHSGYGGYSKWGWGRGVRNFLLRSADPKVPVETWIRLEDGTVRERVLLDHDLGR